MELNGLDPHTCMRCGKVASTHTLLISNEEEKVKALGMKRGLISVLCWNGCTHEI